MSLIKKFKQAVFADRYALRTAIENNDMTAAQDLLSKNPKLAVRRLPTDDTPSKYSEGYCTPMQLAAMHASTDMVDLLLEAGATANDRTKKNWPWWYAPMAIALKFQRENMALHLLAKGADVHYKTHTGHNLIDFAIEGNCNLSTLQTLESHGVKINHIIPKFAAKIYTNLELAINNKNTAVCEYLMQKGEDPTIEVPSDRMWLNLHSNENETLPLIVACINDDIATAEALLKYGADVNTKDSAGRFPLGVAVVAGSENIFTWLLEKDADSTALNAFPNWTHIKGRPISEIINNHKQKELDALISADVKNLHAGIEEPIQAKNGKLRLTAPKKKASL